MILILMKLKTNSNKEDLGLKYKDLLSNAYRKELHKDLVGNLYTNTIFLILKQRVILSRDIEKNLKKSKKDTKN